MTIVSVFGCTGFLGRYVVNGLLKRGAIVIAPFRGDDVEVRHLKVLGDLGQLIPMKFDLQDRKLIQDCIKESDCIINLIGRDYNTRSFSQEQINVEGARTIAELCASCSDSSQSERRRLIHISAIGANSQSKYEFWRTKGVGEQAVREAFPSACIVRPSVMFGYEDRFLNALGLFANYTRVMPLISPSNATKMPVWVCDVAEAICRLATQQSDNDQCMKNLSIQPEGKNFQLPGPRTYDSKELLQLFIKWSMREELPVVKMRVPFYWAWSKLIQEWRQHPKMFRYSQIQGLVQSERLEEVDYSQQKQKHEWLDWSALGMQREKLVTVEEKAIELLRVYRPEDLYFNADLNRINPTKAKSEDGKVNM